MSLIPFSLIRLKNIRKKFIDNGSDIILSLPELQMMVVVHELQEILEEDGIKCGLTSILNKKYDIFLPSLCVLVLTFRSKMDPLMD